MMIPVGLHPNCGLLHFCFESDLNFEESSWALVFFCTQQIGIHCGHTGYYRKLCFDTLKDVKNVLVADRKYEVPSRQIHTDIIARQCWIQCSAGVGSVITTSVSNKYCTYIEFHSAGTPFPHRQAQTTEGRPLDSDDNHEKDWRKHCKHKWNWALTHPQLSIMVLFYTPVTVSLQAASDFSFRLSFLLFYILYSEKQTQSKAIWTLSDLSLSPPNGSAFGRINEKSRRHIHNFKQKNTTWPWMQLIYNISDVFVCEKQISTIFFPYLLCSMLHRHALFASWIQDKKQRANPEVTHP